MKPHFPSQQRRGPELDFELPLDAGDQNIEGFKNWEGPKNGRGRGRTQAQLVSPKCIEVEERRRKAALKNDLNEL
ncbi:hypothetical protein BHM03_00054579 [Ensete ventricosum]|nr:hypothetical protein BHM03_00054579 [Ensete ventricosum]